MSTPEIVDSRYTSHELPPCLGENPSEDALKSWFSNYGWVYLCQITNNSSNNVKFYNPYWSVGGEIEPGNSESYNSKGFIPLWSAPRRYEITYYNKAFKDWKTMTIKDLDGDWLLSFEQANVDEDIREVRSPPLVSESGINLTITDTGYEIYSVSWGSVNSRISWQPI